MSKQTGPHAVSADVQRVSSTLKEVASRSQRDYRCRGCADMCLLHDAADLLLAESARADRAERELERMREVILTAERIETAWQVSDFEIAHLNKEGNRVAYLLHTKDERYLQPEGKIEEEHHRFPTAVVAAIAVADYDRRNKEADHATD